MKPLSGPIAEFVADTPGKAPGDTFAAAAYAAPTTLFGTDEHSAPAGHNTAVTVLDAVKDGQGCRSLACE